MNSPGKQLTIQSHDRIKSESKTEQRTENHPVIGAFNAGRTDSGKSEVKVVWAIFSIHHSRWYSRRFRSRYFRVSGAMAGGELSGFDIGVLRRWGGGEFSFMPTIRVSPTRTFVAGGIVAETALGLGRARSKSGRHVFSSGCFGFRPD